MIHSLNIQRDVDYYVMTNVSRPYDAACHMMSFDEVIYVNTFLHPDIPQSCTGTFTSSTAHSVIACPEGTTQPLSAPPPLKQNHQNYNSTSLNERFRGTDQWREQHAPNLTWNFGEAVYAHPTNPERADEYLAMRCLAHTYGGNSVRIQNLQELIDECTEQTQIIGLLGHSMYFTDLGEPRGRIIIGRQQIVEDPWPGELTSDRVLITDSQIQQKLRDLGNRISPLAVIVLYHCYNGSRRDFIQQLADLLSKPVFAYTGFLGWYYIRVGSAFTVNQISNNWAGVQRRLLKQEFNYQPENIKDIVLDPDTIPVEGDWVAATPSIFDHPPSVPTQTLTDRPFVP